VKNRKKIFLRADGNSIIGYGHLFRLLALAEMLNSHFDCYFVSQELPVFILNELNRLQIETIHTPPFKYCHPDRKLKEDELDFDLATHLTGNEVVVTDGYWFGINYQRSAKACGAQLVCIDDLVDMEFAADVIINHSPGISHANYQIHTSSRLCLGIEFLLVRKVFLSHAKNRSKLAVREKMSTVFISLGGAGNRDVLKKIIFILNDVIDISRIVILGKSFDRIEVDKSISFLDKASQEEIAIMLLECDLLICTPSTISLEACCIGVPIFTLLLAENQRLISAGLRREGAAYSFDTSNLDSISNAFRGLTVDMRKSMVSRQTKLVDGRSDERLLELFTSL
jgi:UDP-2,4-diacetamido-2,4,6-trideoxy-beta-L-altropyranose hydrolase